MLSQKLIVHDEVLNMKVIRRPSESEEFAELTRSEIEATETVECKIDSAGLKQQLYDAAKKVMMKPEFGFPEDEISDYLFVDTEESELLDGTPAIRAEVRAELGYSGMRKIAEVLDKIIQKYCSYAYFDDVTSGVIEAYIPRTDIDACDDVMASSESDDDVSERFYDLEEKLFQALMAGGYDLDDYQGDIEKSDYLNDHLFLQFYSYTDNKGKDNRKALKKLLEKFFKNSTEFASDLDVYVESIGSEYEGIEGFKVQIDAFEGPF